MMNKKRLIPIILVFVIVALLSLFFFLYKIDFQNHQTSNLTSPTQAENKIDKILKNDLPDKINREFLTWLQEQYGEDNLNKVLNELKSNAYYDAIWHKIYQNSLNVLIDRFNGEEDKNKRIKVLESTGETTTLSFIGDVSLADNWYIMPKYDQRKKGIYGILSEDIVNLLNQSEITIANNEFTISNNGEKLPNKYYTFKATPERLKIYKEMSVDLVTLANNHIYDFGEVAFQDSLKSLEENDIPYIGAGRNIEEATAPFYFIANGYKIAFLNATRAEKFILTPEATETSGGVFRCYDPTLLIQQIEKVKQTSDFVVALIHWGKEDSDELETVQVDTAKQYIDAGADLIVGTHAHTLQGIDFYHDKAIIYNLGDFIFNNETKDTAIFQFSINSEGNFQYKIIPCQQKEEYTQVLLSEEKTRVIQKLQKLSPNVVITENGNFYSRSTN